MKTFPTRFLTRLLERLAEALQLLILLGGVLPLAIVCRVLSLALQWYHHHGRA